MCAQWARTVPGGLWHYTSVQAAAGIDVAGFLRPPVEMLDPVEVDLMPVAERRHVQALAAVVWMTSDPTITAATAGHLGLVSGAARDRSERTSVRYRIDPDASPGRVLRFAEWVTAAAVPADLFAALVSDPRCRPDTWFVARGRVRVTDKYVGRSTGVDRIGQ